MLTCHEGPVDAGDLGLQPEHVHEEEDEKGEEEPQRHHLEVAERWPVRPGTGAMHTQEGHQERNLGAHTHTQTHGHKHTQTHT